MTLQNWLKSAALVIAVVVVASMYFAWRGACCEMVCDSRRGGSSGR